MVLRVDRGSRCKGPGLPIGVPYFGCPRGVEGRQFPVQGGNMSPSSGGEGYSWVQWQGLISVGLVLLGRALLMLSLGVQMFKSWMVLSVPKWI